MPKNSQKKRNSRRNRGSAASIIILAVLTLAIYFAWPYISGYLDDLKTSGQTKIIPVGDGEYIEVHVIDVGQGDSILILTSGGNMLIDAGPGSAEDDLEKYLKNQGVADLAYAIFTHPHEDHIGGADMIMTNFTVSNVILPECSADTQTYNRMIDAIDESGANVITALTSSEYTLGSMTATILAPVSETYSNVNNFSIVMKLTFGDTSFILTGDAEKDSEAEILLKFSAEFLKCDVLKVGHHGSDTATSTAFLKVISPGMAAISCGTGNSYGHPHGITLSNLENAGVMVMRTDISGSIIFVSDGKEVTLKNN